MVGFTKSLALETARTGITANTICPGWVLTPLVQQQIDKRIADGVPPEQAREQLLAEKQPSGEFVTPEQLGELALFLQRRRRERSRRCVEYGWRLGCSVMNRPGKATSPPG